MSLCAFQAIHDNPGEWHQQNSVGQRREMSSHRKSQKSKEGSKDQNGRMENMQTKQAVTEVMEQSSQMDRLRFKLIVLYNCIFFGINDKTGHISVLDLEFFLNVSLRDIIHGEI